MAYQAAAGPEVRPAGVARRLRLAATPFGPWLALFLATAGIGVWTAYDRAAAGQKLALLSSAVGLYYLSAHLPAARLPAAGRLLGLGGLLVAAYFLLTYDWQARPSEFGPINALAERWLAIRPAVPGAPLPANVAGSLMAMALPFLAAAAADARRERRRPWLGGLLLAAAVVLLALLMTSSRGAWLALLAAAVLLGGGWLLQRLGRPAAVPRPAFYGLALALLAAVGLGLLLAPGGAIALLDRLPGGASASTRAGLAQATVHLIQDYPFTGGGLASFAGHYSQYVLQIPFNFLPNGHNILLDAAFEQGVAGGLALAVILLGSLLLLGAYVWREADPAAARLALVGRAAAASLIVLIVHGLVEDTVYGSGAAPLLLVLPGLAVALHRSGPPVPQVRIRYRHVAAGLALVAAAFVLLQGRSLLAEWQANRGAVAMARQELAGWPTNRWIDGPDAPDLAAAEAHFQRALANDAAEPTALYRLGLIARSRRDFTAAVRYLAQAYAVQPEHAGIRKALALNYVWAGQLEQAAALLRTMPDTVRELREYAGWWERQGRPDLASQATAALKIVRGEVYRPAPAAAARSAESPGGVTGS